MIVHILGNGYKYNLWNKYKNKKGEILLCNKPPFDVPEAFATCFVDFKMMIAIHEGRIDISEYKWLLGSRPFQYYQEHPDFAKRWQYQIRDVHTNIPAYAQDRMYFNCGHMAAHYAGQKMKAEEIHMYGFNSLFDFDLKSHTDRVMGSRKVGGVTKMQITMWRPIWEGLFNEFSDTQFILYHDHDQIRLNKPDNVEIKVHGKGKPMKNEVDLTHMNRKERRAYLKRNKV